jgi:hypothetical protein
MVFADSALMTGAKTYHAFLSLALGIRAGADFKDKVAVYATEKQLITERRADGIVDRLSERDSMADHSHRTIQDPEVCHGAPRIRTLRNRCEPVAVKAACRAYAWLQARRAA